MSTAHPQLSVAEAAAAVVAEIVNEVGAGEQHTEALMITTADALGDGASRSAGAFGFGTRGNRGVRGIGNVFSYLTSSWALLCIFMAVLLNRTLVYASLRRPTRLSWKSRLLIRIIPVALFIAHLRSTLYALRCQTSPHLPLEAHPLAITIPYNFDEDRSGFLYTLSRILTPWYPSSDSDVAVCQAFGMLPPPEASSDWIPTGSLSVLWPLYRTISIALFLATFSQAIQGPTAAGIAITSTSSDTGLTLFEDSLAFAEAEALVDPRSGNVAPEVLYIALISCLAHLTANIIGILFADHPGGVRIRGVATSGSYRLITTSIWGVAFLGGFLWAIFRGGTRVLGSPTVIGFPTVCVVGFIPHLMVVGGIAICGAIYLLAAFFSTIAPPGPPREGLGHGREYRPPRMHQLDGSVEDSRQGRFLDFSNLQANITLSSLTISWTDDFYTTLLKLGFQCLTAASEATYFNEGEPLRVPGLTWLEQERIRVLERQRKWASEKAALDNGKGDSEVTMFTEGQTKKGYANERTEIKGWMVGLHSGHGANGEEGGNGNEDMANGRSGRRRLGSIRIKRWMGAVELLRGCGGIVGRWVVKVIQALGTKLGLWEVPSEGADGDGTPLQSRHVAMERQDAREVETEDRDLDEAAMQLLRDRWIDADRDDEDRRRLYAAFLQAKSLLPHEEDDDSDEYTPSLRRRRQRRSSIDSTTTISSLSSSLSMFSSTSSMMSSVRSSRSGSRTPTQETPCPPRRSGHSSLSLDSVLDDEEGEEDNGTSQLQQIASLLDPSTSEQRSMAKIMAKHFAAPPGRVITRSRLLGSGATPSSSYTPHHIHPSSAAPVGLSLLSSPEAYNLESLILEKRLPHLRRNNDSPNTNPSEEGVEQDLEHWWGPCVVCQSAPRTVVVWPCRCLALCEECRVSLAMRNFGTCVCCRREVGGVSRIFAV